LRPKPSPGRTPLLLGGGAGEGVGRGAEGRADLGVGVDEAEAVEYLTGREGVSVQ